MNLCSTPPVPANRCRRGVVGLGRPAHRRQMRPVDKRDVRQRLVEDTSRDIDMVAQSLGLKGYQERCPTFLSGCPIGVHAARSMDKPAVGILYALARDQIAKTCGW